MKPHFPVKKAELIIRKFPLNYPKTFCYLALVLMMMLFPKLQAQESMQIIPYDKVEKIPVFPGCETQSRECSLQKIREYIVSNFDREAFSDSLYGTYINMKFIIDSTGKYRWSKVRAKTTKLEEETTRVLENLEGLHPGKHENNQVAVIYDLPLLFDFINPEAADFYTYKEVDIPPIPPECKDSENKKECFSRWIQHFMSANIAMGKFKKGRYNAHITFTIGESGEIINSTAAGKTDEVKKAALKVIEKFPRFTPATKDGRNVNVIYQLPMWGEVR